VRSLVKRWAAIAGCAVAIMPLSGCKLTGGNVAAPTMTVSSEAFLQNSLPVRYTCYGEGNGKVNPPVNWSGAPQGTRSIALVVDDASAPITPYVYWIVFDISPATTDIMQGSLPTGAKQSLNSAGQASYDPPCPPPGRKHSYRFTIYALNTMLSLPRGAGLQTAWKAIAGAAIPGGWGRETVTAKS
jgi:Raf kinase inhibitor-like YbhB/YbcL family protein